MSTMSVIENKLMPIANAVGSNKYMLTLRDTFITSTPLMIIGSLFLLIANFPVEAWTDFIESTMVGSMSVAQILSIPADCTTSMVALFAAYFVGYRFAEHDGIQDSASAGMVSLVAWLMLMPFVTEFTPDGTDLVYEVASLPTTWFGARGILTAILSGLFAVRIYDELIRRDITIKMPAGVPPTVARSFTALIPAAVALTAVLVVRVAFILTPWGNVFDFIFSVLQVPLQGLGSSLPAYVLVRLVAQSLWMFGIHGTSVTGAVYDPIVFSLSLENQEAVAAGLEPLNIINQQFSSLFICIGGDGAVLCLVIAILIACRSKRCRSLGKLALPSASFNISEPMMFGLPIVMNPIMFIPFVLVPVVFIVLTYAVMALGFVPICNGTLVPWSCPIIISGFLVSGWQGAIWQIILTAIGTLIYMPFIKVLDRQYLVEEKNMEEREMDEIDEIDLDALDFDAL